MCVGQEGGFNGSLDAPEAEVLKAVAPIANDSVVYGTYSYEKEKQLKGAKPASSVKVFGDVPDDGKVFFKVLENVLAPRHFNSTTLSIVMPMAISLAASCPSLATPLRGAP